MLNFLIKLPIFKRLIPSIHKKYIFLTKNYFKEVKVNDIYFDLDLRYLIDRRFYFFKEYEEELFIPLVNTIRNNNIDFFLILVLVGVFIPYDYLIFFLIYI